MAFYLHLRIFRYLTRIEYLSFPESVSVSTKYFFWDIHMHSMPSVWNHFEVTTSATYENRNPFAAGISDCDVSIAYAMPNQSFRGAL